MRASRASLRHSGTYTGPKHNATFLFSLVVCLLSLLFLFNYNAKFSRTVRALHLKLLWLRTRLLVLFSL
ncbi:hypothetical protein DL95DRAFT_61713 [Leptodontidium sp. 2 PMI_412]|nr:hypothetical protein DL95DRAFT_61713 [Leptodontidium sp. 2 PMI_412]